MLSVMCNYIYKTFLASRLCLHCRTRFGIERVRWSLPRVRSMLLKRLDRTGMAAARAKSSPKAKEAKALCRDHALLESVMTRQSRCG